MLRSATVTVLETESKEPACNLAFHLERHHMVMILLDVADFLRKLREGKTEAREIEEALGIGRNDLVMALLGRIESDLKLWDPNVMETL